MASISFKIVRICNPQLKCNYLKNENCFLNLLLHLKNLHQILNILKKRMIVIANVFPKLETVKILLRPLSKKPCFRTGFDSQHVKLSQILPKSPWECFCHVFTAFSGKLIWKMSPLVLGGILVVFVDTLTPGGKYLVQYILIQLSDQWKTLSQVFVPFVESTSNFKHFGKKDHGHS